MKTKDNLLNGYRLSFSLHCSGAFSNFLSGKHKLTVSFNVGPLIGKGVPSSSFYANVACHQEGMSLLSSMLVCTTRYIANRSNTVDDGHP